MSQRAVIDGLQFAKGAETLKGTLGMPQLRRLAELRCATDGLSYELLGRTDSEGRCWLHISATGALTLTCQRCLGPIEFPLALESELLLASSEREIVEAEDDIDRVLAGKAMRVGELVEDEVILALPMAPKHEQCEESQDDAKSNRDSPFAALARLKRVQ
jgi:uncharacterized protein